MQCTYRCTSKLREFLQQRRPELEIANEYATKIKFINPHQHPILETSRGVETTSIESSRRINFISTIILGGCNV